LPRSISDSSFAWFTSQASYATGNLFDTGYVVGYLLIALAALHPGGAVAGTSPDQPSRAAMALPYAPILAVAVVSAVMDLAHRPLGPFLYWDGAAMLGLIMGRQLLSLSANQTLSRQLQDTVTALQEREQELAYRAFHDDLTGLPNRAMFHQLLTSELVARDSHRVIVMLIDLDDFKQVNDTHGHHIGDALLAEVAQRLRGSLRGRDIVARLGGDEFAVLLRDDPTTSTADTVARRIRESLDAPPGPAPDIPLDPRQHRDRLLRRRTQPGPAPRPRRCRHVPGQTRPQGPRRAPVTVTAPGFSATAVQLFHPFDAGRPLPPASGTPPVRAGVGLSAEQSRRTLDS
jgi:diguanylate cyclase (GGDEF)-like protein